MGRKKDRYKEHRNDRNIVIGRKNDSNNGAFALAGLFLGTLAGTFFFLDEYGSNLGKTWSLSSFCKIFVLDANLRHGLHPHIAFQVASI